MSETDKYIFQTKKSSREDNSTQRIVFTSAKLAEGYIDLDTLFNTNEKNGAPVLKDNNPDRDEAYAQIIINGQRTKYMVKCDHMQKFFDPDKEGISRSQRRSRVSENLNFRRVNKKAFALYVRFLQTGNKALLLQAEREV